MANKLGIRSVRNTQQLFQVEYTLESSIYCNLLHYALTLRNVSYSVK